MTYVHDVAEITADNNKRPASGTRGKRNVSSSPSRKASPAKRTSPRKQPVDQIGPVQKKRGRPKKEKSPPPKHPAFDKKLMSKRKPGRQKKIGKNQSIEF